MDVSLRDGRSHQPLLASPGDETRICSLPCWSQSRQEKPLPLNTGVLGSEGGWLLLIMKEGQIQKPATILPTPTG